MYIYIYTHIYLEVGLRLQVEEEGGGADGAARRRPDRKPDWIESPTGVRGSQRVRGARDLLGNVWDCLGSAWDLVRNVWDALGNVWHILRNAWDFYRMCGREARVLGGRGPKPHSIQTPPHESSP